MTTTISYLSYSFSGAEILSTQGAVDAGLNGRTLDVDTYSATVRCNDPAIANFNRDDPVRILRGGSQIALLYLTAVTQVGPDLYTLSMTSSLGRLLSMEHRGGVYDGVDAEDVIDAICGVVPHYVQENFRAVKLYGWLPYVSPSGENGAKTGSAKDNLLQVLFALNATLRADAQGVLRIENLSTQVAAELDADAIYREGARVVHEPTVTAVTVIEHQYSPQSGGTAKKLFEGTIAAGGQTVVFSEPIDPTSLAATGFTVSEATANYAVLTAGTGTLTGVPYTHTTREITKAVAAASIPNVVRVADATLVGITNSNDVVDRLVAYYSARERIECAALSDFLDAGNVVSIFDPFALAQREACIEKISPLVISSVEKGSLSALVGYTPWQTVPMEDVTEVLHDSGDWIVPEGVTQLSVIVIGGGDGGEKGSAGEQAKTPSVSNSSRTGPNESPNRRSASILNVSGGKGGKAGSPGDGGKIFRVEISVTPGQIIHYSCGVGGAGEKYDGSVARGFGTATIFGSISSASGTPSEAGYFDVVEQTLFAARGTVGIDGGDGVSYLNDEEQTPPDIIVDGVHYSAGGRASTNPRSASVGRNNSPPGAVAWFGYFGFGGGPAYKADGGDATTAPTGDLRTYGGGRAEAFSPPGGRGGDALPPPSAPNYGCGGAGGNGGGGGGGSGRVEANNYYNYGITSASVVQVTIVSPAVGGDGSDGGNGADGCTILHYRVPTQS